MKLAIIGAGGRIGGLLADRAGQLGWAVGGVTRDYDAVGLDQPGDPQPVVVCTRNDALRHVIARVHPSRWRDLVFVQNGVVGPWLAQQGLTRFTLGVLYIAVPTVGAPPIAGADSVFVGPWARAMAELLEPLRGRATDRAEVDQEVAVKLAWISFIGLIGQFIGERVGEVAQRHADDIAGLCHEALPVLRGALGLSLSSPLLTRRLLDYSASIPHFPAGVKEWEWRNGWLLDAADHQGVPLPLHREWLQRAGIDLG